jgi:hypothetical protein
MIRPSVEKYPVTGKSSQGYSRSDGAPGARPQMVLCRSLRVASIWPVGDTSSRSVSPALENASSGGECPDASTMNVDTRSYRRREYQRPPRAHDSPSMPEYSGVSDGLAGPIDDFTTPRLSSGI